MNNISFSAACFGLLLAVGLSATWAAGGDGKVPPPCEPGYRWVEETCSKQVVREVCKLVPKKKQVKKIVYATKENPFCLRKGGWKGFRCGQDDCGKDAGGICPKCKGPYPRKILVKTEITCEEPTMECVIEKVVETVPCTVWRKVPCDSAPAKVP